MFRRRRSRLGRQKSHKIFFSLEKSYAIMPDGFAGDLSPVNRAFRDGLCELQKEDRDEAYQDAGKSFSPGIPEEGRLRGVSDILPVSLQDKLHRWQSDLREEQEVS
jgi:hypothetical protein